MAPVTENSKHDTPVEPTLKRKPKQLNVDLATENSKQDTPINYFAKFFLSYSIGLSLLVSTMPVLVSKFGLLPMFDSLKDKMSFASSLTSYLWVGFLWANRQFFSKKIFPYTRTLVGLRYNKKDRNGIYIWGSILPGILIIFTVISFFVYTAGTRAATKDALLNNSIRQTSAAANQYKDSIEHRWINRFGLNEEFEVAVKPIRDKKEKITGYDYEPVVKSEATTEQILKRLPGLLIPTGSRIQLYVSFLFIFIFASTAFIIMGLKDYIQQRKGFSDDEIEAASAKSFEIFSIDGYGGIYGMFECVEGDRKAGHTKPVVVQTKDSDNVTEITYNETDNEGMEFYILDYDTQTKTTQKRPIVVTRPKDPDTFILFKEKLSAGAKKRFDEICPEPPDAKSAEQKKEKP